MTKGEISFNDARSRYAKWYGANDKPKEVSALILDHGVEGEVDIAFGENNATEDHYDVVDSWDDLRARTARGAERKFGYRIIKVIEIVSSSPIIYQSPNCK